MIKSVEDLCDDTVHEILSDPAWYGKGSHTGFYRELVKRVHAALSIQQEADAKDFVLMPKKANLYIEHAICQAINYMTIAGANELYETIIDTAMATPTDSEEK